jgi:glycosyltransferase involved in cell wall biosynthesis
MSCRFLYLIGQLRPGGSERQLYYLLKSMDRAAYEPEVVVWNFKETDPYVGRIRALGVPVHALPVTSRAAKLKQFRRLVKQIRPEVIHSFSTHTNFAAFWAALGTNAVAIGGVRSDFDWAKQEAGPVLGRLSGRWPRNQIFNSSAAAVTVTRSKSPFTPSGCLVVRNGIDLETFRSLPLAPNGKAQILGLGSLFPVKRWDRLTSAAVALQARGYDFLIRIVGDGPMRTSLTQRVEQLGLANSVQFVGHANDVSAMLAEATFLVHTSDNEGCPNAVMEAMASGRAVIATNVGDVSQLVEDGKTGFVVPCDDEAILVERMSMLILNRELCRSMGIAGRAKAEREYGLSQLVLDTLNAYQVLGWKDVYLKGANPAGAPRGWR